MDSGWIPTYGVAFVCSRALCPATSPTNHKCLLFEVSSWQREIKIVELYTVCRHTNNHPVHFAVRIVSFLRQYMCVCMSFTSLHGVRLCDDVIRRMRKHSSIVRRIDAIRCSIFNINSITLQMDCGGGVGKMRARRCSEVVARLHFTCFEFCEVWHPFLSHFYALHKCKALVGMFVCLCYKIFLSVSLNLRSCRYVR